MHISSATKPRAAATVRPIIWLVVVTLHGAALAGLTRDFRAPADMIGGAPVIHLTLAPRASFDGVNTPQTPAASATPSRPSDDSPAAKSVLSDPEPPLIQLPLRAFSSEVSFAAWDRNAETSTPARQEPGKGAAKAAEASEASETGLTQGGGAPVVGAAAASNPDVYEAAVLAWIERHKQHPGGPPGVVTVRFTLDRRGALRASEVLVSSGASSMDHAALSQLKDAAPFPRPASNTLWRTRDFVVRLDFRSKRPTG